MKMRSVAANDVRIPDPLPGEAISVERYGKDRKAVVLHPSDFDLFTRLLEIFEDTQAYELTLTDIALEAHLLGESGRDETEIDYESLSTALGE